MSMQAFHIFGVPESFSLAPDVWQHLRSPGKIWFFPEPLLPPPFALPSGGKIPLRPPFRPEEPQKASVDFLLFSESQKSLPSHKSRLPAVLLFQDSRLLSVHPEIRRSSGFPCPFHHGQPLSVPKAAFLPPAKLSALTLLSACSETLQGPCTLPGFLPAQAALLLSGNSGKRTRLPEQSWHWPCSPPRSAPKEKRRPPEIPQLLSRTF